MAKKNAGNPSPNPDGVDLRETRINQKVRLAVKNEFMRVVEHRMKKTVSMNATFPAGQQITAALWLWASVIPPEMKLHALKWSLGLATYDPTLGEQIREALSLAVRGQEPDQSANQGTPGTGK